MVDSPGPAHAGRGDGSVLRPSPLRRSAWLLSFGGLALYVMIALWPFRWDVPRSVPNGAVRDSQGIRFPTAGIARSPGPRGFIRDAIRLESVDVHLRVRSQSPRQFGPVAIFTISRDDDRRNLTLLQNGPDLVVGLRTPSTSLNGTPPHTVAGIFRDCDWHDLALSVRPGLLRLVVDGAERLSARLPAHPLANWEPAYRVALGNEQTGRQAWLGELTFARLEVAGRAIDYARPEASEIPTHYWSGAVRDAQLYPFASFTPGDWVTNVLCFVPLGFVLGMCTDQRRSLSAAIVVCALLATGVEIAQLFSETRHPSVTDWGLNVSGAALGGLAARRFAMPSSFEGQLRKLLLLIVIVGLGLILGTVAAEVGRARQQERAATRIRELGGRIVPDHARPVIGVDLYGTRVTDADLRDFGGMTQLQWLVLEDTAITDVGLAHLQGLSGLQSLGLHGTRVTDKSLPVLVRLTRLGWLSLSQTRVTGAGLDRFKAVRPGVTIDEAGTGHLGPPQGPCGGTTAR